ncbi:TetR/AcrR family transcriptional regulator [Arthrobacter sp. TMN-50]
MATRELLSRDRVLRAARDLADSSGVSAITMRRVAAALGVEAMSLYHHLPGKEELLDGLAEQVVQEILEELGDGHGVEHDDWRAELRHRCLTARKVMLRHPWAPGLLSTRPSMPPSLWPYYDGVLETMLRGGLDYHLAHRGLHALGSMVLGFVQELFSPTADGGNVDTDAAEQDFEAMAAAVPHLTAMMASEVHAAGDDGLGWCDTDSEFGFTLDLLLDGLQRAR